MFQLPKARWPARWSRTEQRCWLRLARLGSHSPGINRTSTRGHGLHGAWPRFHAGGVAAGLAHFV
jgi:hypothetical protein